MRLVNFLPVLAALALALGGTKIFWVFRGRAMRAFAARWGLRYIGPEAPKWRNPRHAELRGTVPIWFTLTTHPSGRRISQVWNVIEGYQNGISVLIFDSILGDGRGSAPCTFIACQAEQNPFGIITSPMRVIQSSECTVLHGVWLLGLSWIMGIKRLDDYMSRLRVGSVREPVWR